MYTGRKNLLGVQCDTIQQNVLCAASFICARSHNRKITKKRLKTDSELYLNLRLSCTEFRLV